MINIHPTTAAIAAGLREQPFDGDRKYRFIAEMVQTVMKDVRLADATDVADAGLDGWDLGWRSEGKRFEISARYRNDKRFETLITAVVDRKVSDKWSYDWLVSSKKLAKTNAKQEYQTGLAICFRDARKAASDKIAEIQGVSKDKRE